MFRKSIQRAVLTAVLAGLLEFVVRVMAPIPYAPRVTDLFLLSLMYGLLAVPAIVLSLSGPRLATITRLLVGAPFGLLVANLAFAFGAESRLAIVLGGVTGAGLGVLLTWRTSARILAAASTLCLLFWAATALHPTRRVSPPAQPSVLLVVLDTTTAGHLSLYGYDKPTSPNLQALARRSLVYRRAIAAAPWTVPSHAAIFSGRYPEEIGFDGVDFDPALTRGSIAADLAAAQRLAVGISANPVVATDPLRRGFDHMWGEWHISRSVPQTKLYHLLHWSQEQTRGKHLTDLALDWIDRLAPPGRPWFLFLNYLDAHAPYDPPERQRREFAPGINPSSIARQPRAYNSGTLPLTAEVRTAVRALYDGEVAAMDGALGRLLTALERRGYDATNLFVIVTADHGESLGEHGFLGHQLGLPDTVLHVPLLVSGPGVQPGEVTTPVQTVQLRATIRALLGLNDATDHDIAPALPPWGAALSLLISQHPFPQWYHNQLHALNPRFDSEPWQGTWVAVERDGIKAVFNDRGSGATYNLRRDPGEVDPQPLREASELVQAYNALPIASRPTHPAPVSEQTREALRNLGYIR